MEFGFKPCVWSWSVLARATCDSQNGRVSSAADVVRYRADIPTRIARFHVEQPASISNIQSLYNQSQCPTWWSPCRTWVAPSIQRRKVWLTPTATCRAVTLPRHETSWKLVD